jgi:hypothetical protein
MDKQEAATPKAEATEVVATEEEEVKEPATEASQKRFSMKMPTLFKKDSDPESPKQSFFSFPKLKKENADEKTTTAEEATAEATTEPSTEKAPKESFKLTLPRLTEPFTAMFHKKNKSADAIVQTEEAQVEDKVEVQVEVAPAAEK